MMLLLQIHLSFSLQTGTGSSDGKTTEIQAGVISVFLQSVGVVLTDVQDVVFKCVHYSLWVSNRFVCLLVFALIRLHMHIHVIRSTDTGTYVCTHTHTECWIGMKCVCVCFLGGS